MKALLFERKVARYAAAAVAGRIAPGRGARVGPLRLADVDPPAPPPGAAGWVRVKPRLSGICGSDLATIDGHSSRYFEPIVSFPFVPGHEIVGDTDDGRRVVVVPILTCTVRGIDPSCPQCAAGLPNRCERVAFGHLEPGLQTGFCESTGGGWSTLLLAHESQLVTVPEPLSDEAAVLVEPAACAVHAAAQLAPGDVAVIGSGTLGLLTIAAAARRGDVEVVAAAKHPLQRRLARELGASVVCEPGELARVLRSRTASWMVDDRLTGGVGQVVDCVGSGESLQQALDVLGPGGCVHAVGMPGVTSLDLTGLWHKELSIRGCYAYDRADFDTAIELVADPALDLGRLVTATYPLARFADALAHAAEAGRRSAVKIAFDLRAEKERTRL